MVGRDDSLPQSLISFNIGRGLDRFRQLVGSAKVTKFGGFQTGHPISFIKIGRELDRFHLQNLA